MKKGKLLLALVFSTAILIFVTSCRETPSNPDGFINITGTVVNVEGIAINNAKVEAIDASDAIIATNSANENGVFSLSNIPANVDNVFIVVTKAGYKTLKVSLKSILENTLDNKIILVLEKEGQNQDCCGNIHITVADNVSKAPIKDVEVRLNKERNVIATYMTGQDGKVNFEKLCPGNYWICVAKEGYAVIEKQITVTNCDPININLLFVKSSDDPCCGVVNMMIFDKASKAGIPEVKVVLSYGDKAIEKKYTDARGVVNFTGLCMGKYWISIERTGYKTIIEDFNIINCDPLNVTFAMEKAGDDPCCGKINVKLYDKADEKRLGGREVTLYKGNVVLAKQFTNEAGEANFTELCVGNYVIKVNAEGYKPIALEVKVTGCDPVPISIGLERVTDNPCCGKIYLTIYDKDTQKPIVGAEVRLTSSDGKVITVKTNENGVATFSDLCMGKYSIRISREGYKVIEQSVEVSNCDPINLTVIMEKTPNNPCCGKIYYILTDKTTGKPIGGAEIKLTSADGRVVVTQKTNENGAAGFHELCMGKYFVRINAEGYKVVDQQVVVENCDPIKVAVSLEKADKPCCGKIYFTVIDKATQKPIVGAEVRLTGADGKANTQKTDEGGAVRFGDLCMGKYGVRVAVDGYKVIEQSVNVEKCDPIQLTLALEKAETDCCKGILYVYVLDETTKTPLVGAEVKLWKDGKLIQSLKTNEKGYVAMERICVGEYSVSINREGYKEIGYKYTHPCNEKVTQTKTMVKLEKECCKGVLKVIVLDKATNDPILNAYLKLTQAGKVIKTVKVNSTGVAIIEGICEGDYSANVYAEGYVNIEYKYTQVCNQTVEDTKFLAKKDPPCTGKLKLQYVDPTKATHYVANAEVKLMLGGVKIASTTTNSEGWAIFERLCTGKYIVNASHEGYAIKEADYTVTNGQTTTDKLEFVPIK